VTVAEDPFVAHRGLLFTVSYEMLGSAQDAEDVVQETWLRWDAIGEEARAAVRDPRAFLVRMVTRKALDRLRSAARRREEYVGEWLPEPLLTAPDVADGGGVVQAVVNPVVGAKKVANLLRPFSRLAPGAEILPLLLNGGAGARIVGTDDGYDTAISFVVDGGRISRIYAVRNPAKLGRIDAETAISR